MQVLGPVRKKKPKSTLPPFKPEHCGHGYGKRRSKKEQEARAEKASKRGTLKSAETTDEPRVKHKNPKLLSKELQKEYLN